MVWPRGLCPGCVSPMRDGGTLQSKCVCIVCFYLQGKINKRK